MTTKAARPIEARMQAACDHADREVMTMLEDFEDEVREGAFLAHVEFTKARQHQREDA